MNFEVKCHIEGLRAHCAPPPTKVGCTNFLSEVRDGWLAMSKVRGGVKKTQKTPNID